MFDLSLEWISIDCPKCKYEQEIQLIDVKNEIVIFCHNCKVEIQLLDDNASAHTAIDNINEAMNELNDLFKKWGG